MSDEFEPNGPADGGQSSGPPAPPLPDPPPAEPGGAEGGAGAPPADSIDDRDELRILIEAQNERIANMDRVISALQLFAMRKGRPLGMPADTWKVITGA